MVNINIMRVECLVRSEFTVPGWTEFTVTLVPAKAAFGVVIERMIGRGLKELPYRLPDLEHLSELTEQLLQYLGLC